MKVTLPVRGGEKVRFDMENKRGSSRTLHGLVGRAWTPSMREEVLAALYLIAGLDAWQAGIRWLAWCLFVKAANDTVCALVAAFAEVLHEGKANANLHRTKMAGDNVEDSE